jgi:predicted DNA-binding transcriptional regulator AlpA
VVGSSRILVNGSAARIDDHDDLSSSTRGFVVCSGIESFARVATRYAQGMSKSSVRFFTLDEVCELIGISKATFYKHQRAGGFPEPLRTQGGRLVFDQSLVDQCVGVVRNRVGVNGSPVVIQKRRKQGATKAQPTRAKEHEHLIAALASLGLTASVQDVEKGLKNLPADLPEPELIRQLFLLLRKPH